ncbi:ATP-binding cassette domain-containing protein [Zooshikella harenae]|uniref:ABC transporter ATP-binding protein n=1 Tax=Zooshikella harenae TaxID=2827238 RepID=A0ABS5ZFD4_9GAMM|nr:ABC transporter ATP-binding protein [Zooshikella harenae]MBU2712777.1 ABC transporter ATP-binding protein [Zooshikella harenae]
MYLGSGYRQADQQNSFNYEQVLVERLATFRHSTLQERYQHSDLVAVLPILVLAQHWPLHALEFLTALPEKKQPNLTDIRNTLARLGISSTLCKASKKSWQNTSFPVMHIPKQAPAQIVFDVGEEEAWIYSLESLQVEKVTDKNKLKVLKKGWLLTVPRYSNDLLEEGKQASLNKPWQRVYPVLMICCFLSLVITSLMLVLPLYVMQVVDQVWSNQRLDLLIPITAGVTGIIILEWGVRQIRSACLRFAGKRVDYLSMRLLLQKFWSGSADCLSISRQRFLVYFGRQFNVISWLLSEINTGAAFDLIFAVFFISVIFVLAGDAGWIALFGFLAGVLWFLYQVVRPVHSEENVPDNHYTDDVVYQFRAMRFAAPVEVWLGRFQKEQIRVFRYLTKVLFKRYVYENVIDGIVWTTVIVTISYTMWLALNGVLSVGAVLAVALLLWQLFTPFKQLKKTLPEWKNAKLSIQSVTQLWRDSVNPAIMTRHAPSQVKGEVSFEDVNFLYPQSNHGVQQLNFNVNAGEVVIVTGGNGAGKTTLLMLLAGLQQAKDGVIRIDRQNINQLSVGVMQYLCAYVPQKPALFQGTLADNLRMANPLATEEELWSVIELCNLDDIVRQLPKGLQTIYDVNQPLALPVNVQQLLCIARALLKPAPVLLMDEPFVGLGYQAELQLLETIQQLCRQKTVFLVTQRPSHFKVADKVLLLEEGKQRYFGHPDQLLKKKKNSNQKVVTA